MRHPHRTRWSTHHGSLTDEHEVPLWVSRFVYFSGSMPPELLTFAGALFMPNQRT